MTNHLAKGKDYAAKADKQLSGWGIFGNKYESAAENLETATNSFKLANAWGEAAKSYDKLAMCYAKAGSDHEVADAKSEAGNCYTKLSAYDIAIARYKDAAEDFDIRGRWSLAARSYENIANLHLKVSKPDIGSVMEYFEKAAQRYDTGNMTSNANSCRLKIAKLAAEKGNYKEAIDIYENIAQLSLRNNLLKFGARKHLLLAGICRFCDGESDDFIKTYTELDPSFSTAREYRLLLSIAGAMGEPTEENITSALSLYTEIQSTMSDDFGSGKSDEMSSRKPLMATLSELLEKKILSGGSGGQEDEEDLT